MSIFNLKPITILVLFVFLLVTVFLRLYFPNVLIIFFTILTFLVLIPLNGIGLDVVEPKTSHLGIQGVLVPNEIGIYILFIIYAFILYIIAGYISFLWYKIKRKKVEKNR